MFTSFSMSFMFSMFSHLTWLDGTIFRGLLQPCPNPQVPKCKLHPWSPYVCYCGSRLSALLEPLFPIMCKSVHQVIDNRSTCTLVENFKVLVCFKFDTWLRLFCYQIFVQKFCKLYNLSNAFVTFQQISHKTCTKLKQRVRKTQNLCCMCCLL